MKTKGFLLLSLLILLLSPGLSFADSSSSDIVYHLKKEIAVCNRSYDKFLTVKETIKDFTFAKKPLSEAQKGKYCPALFQGAGNVVDMLDHCPYTNDQKAEWTLQLNYLTAWHSKYCK